METAMLANTLAINKLALKLPIYIVNETHKEFIICVFVKKYIIKRLSEVALSRSSKGEVPQEDLSETQIDLLKPFICDLIPNWFITDDIRYVFSISKPFERNYKTINKRTLEEYISDVTPFVNSLRSSQGEAKISRSSQEEVVPDVFNTKPTLFEDIIIEIDKPQLVMNQTISQDEVNCDSVGNETDDLFYDTPNKFDEFKKKLEECFKKDKMNGSIPSFSQQSNQQYNIWKKPDVESNDTSMNDLIKSNLKLSELNEKTQSMYLHLKKENEEMIDYNIKMSIDNTRVTEDNNRLVNEASDLTKKNEDYKLNKKHLCDYIKTLETKNVKLLTELIVCKNTISRLERSIQQNEIALDRREYKNEKKMTRKIISLKRNIKTLKNTKNILIDNINERKVVEMETQTEPEIIETTDSPTSEIVEMETQTEPEIVQDKAEIVQTEMVPLVSFCDGLLPQSIGETEEVKKCKNESDNSNSEDIDQQDAAMSEITISDKADSNRDQDQDMDWGWSDDEII